MALFFRRFPGKNYQKLIKKCQFSAKMRKKLSKFVENHPVFSWKKSAIYFGKLSLFSKILSPLFQKSSWIVLPPQKRRMYLINFFCGFFVKLSSALAPPARPVRTVLFAVGCAEPNLRQKELCRYTLNKKKQYIYTFCM